MSYCDVCAKNQGADGVCLCPACLTGYETRAATKARAEERAAVVAWIRTSLAYEMAVGDDREEMSDHDLEIVLQTIEAMSDGIEAGEHEAKETVDG